MEEKIKNRILKVYTLSQRGVDGEKEAAEVQLQRLLKKYGIELTDIIEEKEQVEIHFLSQDEKEIIDQCFLNFFGTKSDEINTYQINKYLKTLYLTTDIASAKLFVTFVKFHLNNFRKFKKMQQKAFVWSYTHAHKLYDVAPDENEKSSNSSLTSEEVAAILEQSKCADRFAHYHKQLSK